MVAVHNDELDKSVDEILDDIEKEGSEMVGLSGMGSDMSSVRVYGFPVDSNVFIGSLDSAS